jgi:hypothetical protein
VPGEHCLPCVGVGSPSITYGARQAVALTILLATALLVAGCGPGANVGTVSGRVTLDGTPVSDATIAFENAKSGVSVNASLAADGTFTVRTFDKPGLPPGDYRVAVRPGTFSTGEAPLVAPPRPMAAKTPIPAKYHNAATSELTATVKVGSNSPYEFALKSEP